MTVDDCGGSLSFYGRDPILPSRVRFGTMAAIGLAARSVALAALWKQATREGQDIAVGVRKALRRSCGLHERKWETINGRPPTLVFLRCVESPEAIDSTILQWRGKELEEAAAEAGLVVLLVRTNEEMRREPQHRLSVRALALSEG
jgi:hypothetical protein